MIRSFRQKGLKRFFEENDGRGLSVEHYEKLRRILARMDSANIIADMDLPGYRVIFQFEQGVALNVDSVDYH